MPVFPRCQSVYEALRTPFAKTNAFASAHPYRSLTKGYAVFLAVISNPHGALDEVPKLQALRVFLISVGERWACTINLPINWGSLIVELQHQQRSALPLESSDRQSEAVLRSFVRAQSFLSVTPVFNLLVSRAGKARQRSRNARPFRNEGMAPQ